MTTADETLVQVCPHTAEPAASPRSSVCEECGSDYNLRACLECGHVGCCESQQAHNTAHFRASGHAVIQSMPAGEHSFTWCYECDRYL